MPVECAERDVEATRNVCKRFGKEARTGSRVPEYTILKEECTVAWATSVFITKETRRMKRRQRREGQRLGEQQCFTGTKEE